MTTAANPLDLEIAATCRRLADLLERRAGNRDVAIVEDVEDPDQVELLDAPTAANRFQLSKDTVQRWCRDHGIGVKQGGRWFVSVDRLRRHMGAQV